MSITNDHSSTNLIIHCSVAGWSNLVEHGPRIMGAGCSPRKHGVHSGDLMQNESLSYGCTRASRMGRFTIKVFFVLLLIYLPLTTCLCVHILQFASELSITHASHWWIQLIHGCSTDGPFRSQLHRTLCELSTLIILNESCHTNDLC